MKKMATLLTGFMIALIGITKAQTQTQTPIDLDQFLRLIEEKKPKTVEEALELLPSEFRSRYAIVYESKSIQTGSRSEPRILIRGQAQSGYDDSFLMAFNGSTSQVGGNSIELMQYRSGTQNFEMREVQFENGKAHISKQNPETCQRCHGSDARPIWDSYFVWPGVIGGDDNRPRKSESELLAQFERQRTSHPRYSRLPEYKHQSQIERGNLIVGPLSDLTRNLFKKNSERIARKIKANRSLYPFRFAILGSFLSCRKDSFEDFFPKAWLQASLRSIDDLHSENTLKQNNHFRSKVEELNRLMPLAQGEWSRASEALKRGGTSESSTELFARLQFIGGLSHSSVEDWSASRDPGGATFEDGFPTAEQYSAALEVLWNSEDGDINRFRVGMKGKASSYPIDSEEVEDICDDLVDLSLKELKKFTPEHLKTLACAAGGSTDGGGPVSGQIEELNASLKQVGHVIDQNAVPKAFALCAQCHQGEGRSASLIRFDSPESVARARSDILSRIQLEPGRRGAMPPPNHPKTNQYLKEHQIDLSTLRSQIEAELNKK